MHWIVNCVTRIFLFAFGYLFQRLQLLKIDKTKHDLHIKTIDLETVTSVKLFEETIGVGEGLPCFSCSLTVVKRNEGSGFEIVYTVAVFIRIRMLLNNYHLWAMSHAAQILWSIIIISLVSVLFCAWTPTRNLYSNRYVPASLTSMSRNPKLGVKCPLVGFRGTCVYMESDTLTSGTRSCRVSKMHKDLNSWPSSFRSGKFFPTENY